MGVAVMANLSPYTKKELESNPNLSFCAICGLDCFYLALPGENNPWWHEEYEMDLDHQATKGGE